MRSGDSTIEKNIGLLTRISFGLKCQNKGKPTVRSDCENEQRSTKQQWGSHFFGCFAQRGKEEQLWQSNQETSSGSHCLVLYWNQRGYKLQLCLDN